MSQRFRAPQAAGDRPKATEVWASEFMRLYGFGANCSAIKNTLQRRRPGMARRLSTSARRNFHA
jgi:hypothetical protein